MDESEEARGTQLPDPRVLARPYTAEAVSVLVAIMRGTDKRMALTAAQEILNRGYGRPSAKSAADDDTPFDEPILMVPRYVDP